MPFRALALTVGPHVDWLRAPSESRFPAFSALRYRPLRCTRRRRPWPVLGRRMQSTETSERVAELSTPKPVGPCSSHRTLVRLYLRPTPPAVPQWPNSPGSNLFELQSR